MSPTSPRGTGFLGSPRGRETDGFDAVVLGVPYDLATGGRSGAREGPEAIRRASPHLDWETRHWPWPFALGERLRILDYGDLEFEPGRGDEMMADLETTARELVSGGRTLLTFGGDHFISLPLLRAHAALHGPLSLIHFDAHGDMEPIEDDVLHHGNLFRRAIEEELVDPARSVQVGLRTEHEVPGEPYPFTVLDADHVVSTPPAELAAEILRVCGDAAVYLSFDIDCLDPAFAPGTGTPVPGGPDTNRVLRVIRALTPCHLVGMDVVEVAPAYDHAELAALAAASIAWELLHVVASRR